jgi:hypothetical protein
MSAPSSGVLGLVAADLSLSFASVCPQRIRYDDYGKYAAQKRFACERCELHRLHAVIDELSG